MNEIQSDSKVLRARSEDSLSEHDLAMIRARRTAFVARFIVLRENKRSRAHRKIEQFDWSDGVTAEELHDRFRAAFIENGDNMIPVDRDLRRALTHANPFLRHFLLEYESRSTLSFSDSLNDYERSVSLLFPDSEQRPKSVGWKYCKLESRLKIKRK